jgi:hypothetical protein
MPPLIYDALNLGGNRPADIAPGLKRALVGRDLTDRVADLLVIELEGLSGHEPAAALGAALGPLIATAEDLRTVGQKVGFYGPVPVNSNQYTAMRWAAFNDPAAPAWARDADNTDTKAHLANYAKWQDGNDRLARVLLPHCTAVIVELYPLNADPQDWRWLLKGSVDEARRVAAGKPVFGIVAPFFHQNAAAPLGNTPAGYDFFKLQLETAAEVTDGLVLWGSPHSTYNEADGWVKALRDVTAPPAPVPVPVPVPEPQPPPAPDPAEPAGPKVGTAGFSFPTDKDGWPVYPQRADAVEVRVRKGESLAGAVASVPNDRQGIIRLECGGEYDFAHPPPGRGPDAPLVIRGFGPGPRPRLKAKHHGFAQGPASWVVLNDLELVGPGNVKGSHGIQLIGKRGWALVGCLLRDWGMAVGVQDNSADFVLYRNVFRDNFDAAGGDGSGAFIGDCAGVYAAENYFIDCGKGFRSHGLYLAGDCTRAVVEDNFFARPGSHGVQLRCGGTLVGNYFLDCPIGASVGWVMGNGPMVPGGVTATVGENVHEGYTDIVGTGGGKRGWALDIAHARDVAATDNLFIRGNPKRAPVQLQKCYGEVKQPDGTWKKVRRPEDIGLKSVRLADNVQADWPGPLTQANNSIGTAGVKETGTRKVAVKRTLADYAKAFGAADVPALLAHMAMQRRGQWSPKLTGGAAAEYVRAGY